MLGEPSAHAEAMNLGTRKASEGQAYWQRDMADTSNVLSVQF